MAAVTLFDLFAGLNGEKYGNRQDLEEAVLDVVNSHLGELPIGFSYRDAIDGARREGWLRPNGTPTGVVVDLDHSAQAA